MRSEDDGSLAPVALFVYNRPEHTAATLSALARNHLAHLSDLTIFSDAPRTPEHGRAVSEVRNLLGKVGGFKSVSLVLRDKNFGLAKSIIDGVTAITKQHHQVIVLEDDLLTSPHFLDFMNTALKVYQNTPEVMHISGSNFPIKAPGNLPSSFFYRATSCWGWATWERAWQTFEPNAQTLLDAIYANGLSHGFDIDGDYAYCKMLEKQAAGLLDSWAIRWYARVYLRRGMCLHPAYSLVNNIGFDETGTHCDTSQSFAVDLSRAEQISLTREASISECGEAVRQIRHFFRSQRPPLYKRGMSLLRRSLP